jgi:hypothetical protein
VSDLYVITDADQHLVSMGTGTLWWAIRRVRCPQCRARPNDYCRLPDGAGVRWSTAHAARGARVADWLTQAPCCWCGARPRTGAQLSWDLESSEAQGVRGRDPRTRREWRFFFCCAPVAMVGHVHVACLAHAPEVRQGPRCVATATGRALTALARAGRS